MHNTCVGQRSSAAKTSMLLWRRVKGSPASIAIFTSEPVGRSESTDDIRPYKILEILTYGDQTSMVIKFIEVTELEFEVRNDL